MKLVTAGGGECGFMDSSVELDGRLLGWSLGRGSKCRLCEWHCTNDSNQCERELNG